MNMILLDCSHESLIFTTHILLEKTTLSIYYIIILPILPKHYTEGVSWTKLNAIYQLAFP